MRHDKKFAVVRKDFFFFFFCFFIATVDSLLALVALLMLIFRFCHHIPPLPHAAPGVEGFNRYVRRVLPHVTCLILVRRLLTMTEGTGYDEARVSGVVEAGAAQVSPADGEAYVTVVPGRAYIPCGEWYCLYMP